MMNSPFLLLAILILCALGAFLTSCSLYKPVNIPVPVDSAKVNIPPQLSLPTDNLEDTDALPIVLKAYVVSHKMLLDDNQELRSKLTVCQ